MNAAVSFSMAFFFSPFLSSFLFIFPPFFYILPFLFCVFPYSYFLLALFFFTFSISFLPRPVVRVCLRYSTFRRSLAAIVSERTRV